MCITLVGVANKLASCDSTDAKRYLVIKQQQQQQQIGVRLKKIVVMHARKEMSLRELIVDKIVFTNNNKICNGTQAATYNYTVHTRSSTSHYAPRSTFRLSGTFSPIQMAFSVCSSTALPLCGWIRTLCSPRCSTSQGTNLPNCSGVFKSTSNIPKGWGPEKMVPVRTNNGTIVRRIRHGSYQWDQDAACKVVNLGTFHWSVCATGQPNQCSSGSCGKNRCAHQRTLWALEK